MPLATQADAVREYARNVGHARPEQEYILSDYDTWERNPHYTGKPGRHPEDDRPETAELHDVRVIAGPRRGERKGQRPGSWIVVAETDQGHFVLRREFGSGYDGIDMTKLLRRMRDAGQIDLAHWRPAGPRER